MDFSLSEDQLAFVDSARAFSEGALAPNAAEWDLTDLDSLSVNLSTEKKEK